MLFLARFVRVRFVTENADGVPARLHENALHDGGRLGDELPPVARDDIGNDEEDIGGNEQNAGCVVDAYCQCKIDEWQIGAGEMQAHAGDAEGQDQQRIGPMPDPDPRRNQIFAISHGSYSGDCCGR